MSDANREFYTDPYRIAEGFLSESFLWHPRAQPEVLCLLTRVPYDYDAQAECPRWLASLDDVMQGDADRKGDHKHQPAPAVRR